MGYYSEMLPIRIKVDSDEEFEAKWKVFVEGFKEREYLEIYEWEKVRDGEWELNVPDLHKHYYDRELVEFISIVISEDDRVVVEFIGEDGERWGYYVRKGKVDQIMYVRMVGNVILEVDCGGRVREIKVEEVT